MVAHWMKLARIARIRPHVITKAIVVCWRSQSVFFFWWVYRTVSRRFDPVHGNAAADSQLLGLLASYETSVKVVCLVILSEPLNCARRFSIQPRAAGRR
jgi:hypothetical protein